MEPERAIKRRQVPTLALLLKTLDGGATWKSDNRSAVRHCISVRLRGDNGLAVFEFNQSFDWPSEVYRLDCAAARRTRVYRERLRVMDCALFRGPRAVSGGVEPPGKLEHSRRFRARSGCSTSTNLTDWTEMDVDYKASARSLVLAGPDAATSVGGDGYRNDSAPGSLAIIQNNSCGAVLSTDVHANIPVTPLISR